MPSYVSRFGINPRSLIFALSVAVAFFSVAVAIRSFQVGDSIGAESVTFGGSQFQLRGVRLATSDGRLLFSFRTLRSDHPTPAQSMNVFRANHRAGLHLSWNSQYPDDISDVGWNQSLLSRWGFVARHFTMRNSLASDSIHLGVPLWCIAACASIVPFRKLLRWRIRSRRMRKGRCASCGYDLRGNPQRCPECGLQGVATPLPSLGQKLRKASPFCLLLVIAVNIAMSGWWLRRGTWMPATWGSTASIRSTNSSASQPTTTRPVLPFVLALPQYHPDRPVPPELRALAAAVDPNGSYVFLHIQPGDMSSVRRHQALVQIFKRLNGRWRYDLRYLGIGEEVGSAKFPCTSTIGEIRIVDDDVLVTFLNEDGTRDCRSAKADFANPIRRFLDNMCSNGGEWEKVLFPPQSGTHPIPRSALTPPAGPPPGG